MKPKLFCNKTVLIRTSWIHECEACQKFFSYSLRECGEIQCENQDIPKFSPITIPYVPKRKSPVTRLRNGKETDRRRTARNSSLPKD